MDKVKTIYDFRGFEGSVDVSLDISLFEYGLIHQIQKDGNYKFVYGIKTDRAGNYNTFSQAFFDEGDFQNLITDSWFELQCILNYIGESKEDWLKRPLHSRIHDCIGYHGHENIFGEPDFEFEVKG